MPANLSRAWPAPTTKDNMNFIDTHCHLDAAEFNGEQESVVRAAQAAGVGLLVVPAIERANFTTVQMLCAQYKNCVPAYGIHPMYADRAVPADLGVLREFLALPGALAVGEIGMDFFIKHYDQAAQEYFFVEQLKLAQEFDLPVLLHIRRAQDTILKHLRQHKVRGGIAHAFNGSRQQADEFIKLGFKLGFGGAMTYDRATRLRELAATLPQDSIVLETDAPDIPPSFLQKTSPLLNPDGTTSHSTKPASGQVAGYLPQAGEEANELLRKIKINEPNKPEYLPRIAQTLAELRGMSLEEVARITTENVLSALPKIRPYIATS